TTCECGGRASADCGMRRADGEVLEATACSVLRTDPNLFRLLFAQRQMIAADFDFNRVTQGSKPNQFNGRTNEQPHFQEAAAVFGSHFNVGDNGHAADGERSQRLTFGGHGQSALAGEEIGSTKMASANWLLIARRALQ